MNTLDLRLERDILARKEWKILVDRAVRGRRIGFHEMESRFRLLLSKPRHSRRWWFDPRWKHIARRRS